MKSIRKNNTKKNNSVYYIDISQRKRNTAGAKAPEDVAKICGKLGFKRFFMPCYPDKKNKYYRKAWLVVNVSYYWAKLLLSVPKGGTIIYQHPSYGHSLVLHMIRLIKKIKGVRFIALIHDLESLRGGIEGVIANSNKRNYIADQLILKEADSIICHNDHMKEYLIGQGFEEARIANLEIFDYLSKVDLKKITRKHEKPTIAIAGTLAIGKCRYIYDICKNGNNPTLVENLYGINYEDSETTENMKYHGSFPPEEVISVLDGDFGLVWDGISTESCLGNTGNYLRYNNPHKTSLYLTSGLPVIVWSEAAIADFVLKENVGITVDNLNQLEEKISSISEDDYLTMCENAYKIAKRLRSGYYTRKAILGLLKAES